MAQIIQTECGCEFEVGPNGPIMPTDINALDLECEMVWDLISSGRTIGCFQIDSGLGQTMSKQLKPKNIEHLAALIAIMRPSCLQSTLEDGKSVAQHFIDRKNRIEPAICQYPQLSTILKNTYGLMIYQEQAIQIGQEIAGMSLQDSDHYIRYGIGKKKSSVIAEAKKIFLEGCKKVNKVSEKEAEGIFQWIESSQRYSFNLSHSVGYAMLTFLTAYGKSHFPRKFFRSWLNHSYDKINPLEEIRNLVIDARSFDIDILNPDLRLKNSEFIEKNERLCFGLEYIKGVGSSGIRTLQRLLDDISKTKVLDDLGWIELLLKTLLEVNKTTIKNLIAVGALDYLKIPREQMLFEHDICLKFTKKELDWIINNLNLKEYSNLQEILEEILLLDTGKDKPIANKNRKNIIKGLHYSLVNPPYSLSFNLERNIALERSFLGVELSVHKLDLIKNNISDCTTKEFNNGANYKIMKFMLEISKINTILTKKTQSKMSFISGVDQTGQLNDIVIFPEIYNKYKNLLTIGNCVLVVGKKGIRDNLIVSEIHQAN